MKKVGLIGSGRIAPFYADVLKDYDNCEVSVCGSSGSSSAKDLADKFGFRYFKTAKDLIDANDFIIIACTNKYALDYLKLCDTLGKKILVEKPLYEENDSEYVPINNENIFIGYNRRFYRSVNALKDLCFQTSQRLLIQINAPERFAIDGDKYFPLKSNGVHLLDLATYLVDGIQSFEIDMISTINTLVLKIIGNRHNAIINWRFGAVSGTSIDVDIDDKTHILKPIECYKVYHKLEIVESKVGKTNIRTYIPQSYDKDIDDRLFQYKPGFQLQIKNFLTESGSITTTSLKEAYNHVQIMKEIVKFYYNH